MLAELFRNAYAALRDQQQALGQVHTEGPDIQARHDGLGVLALLDQIRTTHSASLQVPTAAPLSSRRAFAATRDQRL